MLIDAFFNSIKNEIMNIVADVKITVGMTTYNRPEFLKEAVCSVLQQTYRNFELIISNDYVATPVTIESLGIEGDERIQIVNQDPNLGEIKNMNYLLDNAQGEWFVWLGDDDLFHPEFLMRAYQAILSNENSNIVGFFSNYRAASNPDGVFPQHLKGSKELLYDAPGFLKGYSSREIPLIGCYGIMRTVTLREVGGIPRLGNSFGPYGDTLVPILLVERGGLCWLNEEMIFLRTHPESLSCKSSEFSAYTTAEDDFLKNIDRVCSSKLVNIVAGKIIANMVRWFSADEWAVLHRDTSLRKFALFRKYIKYQISVNLPRLSIQNKIMHIIFLFYFLGVRLLVDLYRALRTFLKNIVITNQIDGKS